jgi:hypothetical protein
MSTALILAALVCAALGFWSLKSKREPAAAGAAAAHAAGNAAPEPLQQGLLSSGGF